MYFDLPLEQLKTYQPARQEPSGYDAFWEETLAQICRSPLAARFESVDFGLQTVESFGQSRGVCGEYSSHVALSKILEGLICEQTEQDFSVVREG